MTLKYYRISGICRSFLSLGQSRINWMRVTGSLRAAQAATYAHRLWPKLNTEPQNFIMKLLDEAIFPTYIMNKLSQASDSFETRHMSLQIEVSNFRKK